MTTKVEDVEFSVKAGYDDQSKQPYVEIHINSSNDTRFQLTPEEATGIAHDLLTASRASYLTSFLVEWVEEKGGNGALMMIDFRQWLEKRVNNART